MSNSIGNQNLVRCAITGIEVSIKHELEALEKDFGIQVDSIYVDLLKSVAGNVIHPRVTITFKS